MVNLDIPAPQRASRSSHRAPRRAMNQARPAAPSPPRAAPEAARPGAPHHRKWIGLLADLAEHRLLKLAQLRLDVLDGRPIWTTSRCSVSCRRRVRSPDRSGGRRVAPGPAISGLRTSTSEEMRCARWRRASSATLSEAARGISLGGGISAGLLECADALSEARRLRLGIEQLVLRPEALEAVPAPSSSR